MWATNNEELRKNGKPRCINPSEMRCRSITGQLAGDLWTGTYDNGTAVQDYNCANWNSDSVDDRGGFGDGSELEAWSFGYGGQD